MISVAEDGCSSCPVVFTCGEKQILTTLEAPATDCTDTLILLSAEQKLLPEQTLAQLKEEQCRNTRYKIASRPLPHCTRDDETKLARVRKVKTIAPVLFANKVDGDVSTIVVLEGLYPQGSYLGRKNCDVTTFACKTHKGKLG